MRRRRHHYRPMGALGEPITLTTAALWAIGGFVAARIFTKRDNLTPQSIQRAQVLADFLKQSQLPAEAIYDEAIIAEFVDRNPDLLNASLYAGGSAPSKQDLINEIKAIVQYVQTTGKWTDYSVAAKTLQGIPLYGRGFGAAGRR